jgi:hypothetical protein
MTGSGARARIGRGSVTWRHQVGRAVALGAACPALVLGAAGLPAAGAAGLPRAVLATPAAAVSNVLDGGSCTARRACEAVGTHGSVSLAEGWDNSPASVQATPVPPGKTEAALEGVSCTSPAACTAVGYAAGPSASLAEAWNGVTWTIQATPSVPGATGSALAGVSCASPAACVAVGDYDQGSVILPLAEVWNGSAWTAQAPPYPAGGSSARLTAVSCVSAARCVAAGTYVTGGVIAPLAEVWNGTTWTYQAPPSPGADGSVLTGVSCVSATVCVAVGWDDNGGPHLALAETWNGTTWTVRNAPSVTMATTELLGVSCTSASTCMAVGYSEVAGPVVSTLAEAWNGTAWKIVAPQNRAGASWSSLAAVSCTKAAACTAVGHSYASGTNSTLAEVWNGTTWKFREIRNPSVGGRPQPATARRAPVLSW